MESFSIMKKYFSMKHNWAIIISTETCFKMQFKFIWAEMSLQTTYSLENDF